MRFTPEELGEIRARADQLGQSVAQYIHDRVLHQVREVLPEELASCPGAVEYVNAAGSRIVMVPNWRTA
jgi:hypothetical protein